MSILKSYAKRQYRTANQDCLNCQMNMEGFVVFPQRLAFPQQFSATPL